MIYLILIFFGLLCLNFYLRLKVLSYYRILVNNKVQFNAIDIFDPQKIESEIIPRYPEQSNEIRKFTRNIRWTIIIGSVYILLVGILYLILRFSNG